MSVPPATHLPASPHDNSVPNRRRLTSEIANAITPADAQVSR